jgi:hypothetical protein
MIFFQFPHYQECDFFYFFAMQLVIVGICFLSSSKLKCLYIYQALEEALVRDIPTMINCLKNLGLHLPVDLDKLTHQLQEA